MTQKLLGASATAPFVANISPINFSAMHPVAMDPGRAKRIDGSPGFPEPWQTSPTGKGLTNEMNEKPGITHLELMNGMGMSSQIK
jgi:hypothetical protein